ncbi:epoxide hydrolase [Phytoactinopolyspora alkaliphila]|uniref:Epoxide hydrolase n=1 Tax=Phytoactinopolyspora alkaliphila TaxID=1783498 RepID=A0A6N9YJN7_9ACTN|nr:epoxide hydrolase family protein [Phytoactinopolyspora alkaliphila]NED95226.1 epoxide hydrolase [Phytoactinopolyspora alkaliphila]
MKLRDQRIHISDEVLTDLARRIASTRQPTAPVRPGWSDGIDPDLVRFLAEYWQVGFDWRAREKALNRYRHVRAVVDGVSVHTMICQPTEPGNGLPLLALHGWPSTFEQMTRLADRLSGPPHAMTVVVPSLPGFGFSASPAEPGWDLARIAHAMQTLMTEHLGYTRYLVRGTDYGLTVALHLGALYPNQVAGVHIGGTHLAVPDDADLPTDLTDEERTFVDTSRRWYAKEGGYVAIQSTKPETVAHALSDSPVGLLAWITEKYRTWCATPDDLHASFSPDDLLSTATIYWATNTIASSMRLYREDLLGTPVPRSIAPVAVNQPSLEEYLAPKSWYQRFQPLSRYTLLPGAGHFPEWEAPDALAADLAEFAASLH